MILLSSVQLYADGKEERVLIKVTSCTAFRLKLNFPPPHPLKSLIVSIKTHKCSLLIVRPSPARGFSSKNVLVICKSCNDMPCSRCSARCKNKFYFFLFSPSPHDRWYRQYSCRNTTRNCNHIGSRVLGTSVSVFRLSPAALSFGAQDRACPFDNAHFD